MQGRYRAVLFDLDGTLIDSAPDLAGAANDLRERRGLAPLQFELLRPWVGAGARGMIGAAFSVAPGDASFGALRDEFLAIYEQRMLSRTAPFDGVDGMLNALEAAALPWGIVTNKASRYTEPIVRGLGLAARAAVVISGDSTPHAKPHPEPLLAAARTLQLQPADCLYVGDDLRDVQAGRAAGMTTVAVRWGYLGVGSPVDDWGADHIGAEPLDVLKLLGLA
jgi:phosphoglycolate phosphatase